MMLSRQHAEKIRADYVEILEKELERVKKNFKEMDLERVELKYDMESKINQIEGTIKDTIRKMNYITFE